MKGIELRYKVIAGIALISIISPLIVYIIHFWGYSLSSDGDKWGTFGDFMGGVLNPIIALLTLFVTIFIAIELSNLEGSRSREAIQFEKIRFRNELREAEYRRITTLLQDVPALFLVSKENIDTINRSNQVALAYSSFKFFTQFNGHIFPFLQDSICKEFGASLEELLRIAAKEKLTTQEELMNAIRNYMFLLVKLSQEFQKYIIEAMD